MGRCNPDCTSHQAGNSNRRCRGNSSGKGRRKAVAEAGRWSGMRMQKQQQKASRRRIQGQRTKMCKQQQQEMVGILLMYPQLVHMLLVLGQRQINR